jgi:hypothetical protein
MALLPLLLPPPLLLVRQRQQAPAAAAAQVHDERQAGVAEQGGPVLRLDQPRLRVVLQPAQEDLLLDLQLCIVASLCSRRAPRGQQPAAPSAVARV